MNPDRVSRRRWRRALVAAVAAGLALTAVGCSSSSDDEATGDTITVKDFHGEQTITLEPERIVALDNQWIDSLLALDVTPVGYLDNAAVVGGSTPPWQGDELKDSKQLKFTGDLIEEIGELSPDLILIPNYMITDEQYNQLKALAPTLSAVTTTTPAGVDPWDDRVEVLGEILNKEDTADEVIADVNGKLDGIATKYPGLQGKTFLTAYLFGGNITVLADPNDGSAKIFEKFGMSIPQSIIDIKGPTGRPAISAERIGDLDSDLLIAASSGPDQNAFAALPGYDSLPAVQKDAVAVVDLLTVTGLNQPTPLALPYAIDKIEPALANAAK